MILCAALKVKLNKSDDSDFVILPCRRHGDGFKILQKLGYDRVLSLTSEQGFITTQGEFLDRKEALNHATDCGQLTQTALWYKEDTNLDELFSEDLY